MHTRLTRLLGIQHPIVLPGMTYIAVPRLVAAVCNAGGMGILASGGLTPQACREAIREVRRLTDRPFGVGCSLLLPGAAECARVALEEQVPVINVSMGKGEWVMEGARQYGGQVIATISNEAHATAPTQRTTPRPSANDTRTRWLGLRAKGATTCAPRMERSRSRKRAVSAASSRLMPSGTLSLDLASLSVTFPNSSSNHP